MDMGRGGSVSVGYVKTRECGGSGMSRSRCSRRASMAHPRHYSGVAGSMYPVLSFLLEVRTQTEKIGR
jgi:hypothetical protein